MPPRVEASAPRSWAGARAPAPPLPCAAQVRSARQPENAVFRSWAQHCHRWPLWLPALSQLVARKRLPSHAVACLQATVPSPVMLCITGRCIGPGAWGACPLSSNVVQQGSSPGRFMSLCRIHPGAAARRSFGAEVMGWRSRAGSASPVRRSGLQRKATNECGLPQLAAGLPSLAVVVACPVAVGGALALGCCPVVRPDQAQAAVPGD